MADKAGVYDILIEKGSDFSLNLFYKTDEGVAIDLTGCSVEADIKSIADLSASPVLSFTTSIPSPQTQGKITLTLTKAQTTALAGTGPNYKYIKEYAYDVLVNLTSGLTKRILNGKINVSPGVTS